MLNPVKLYVKSQEVQLNWIRNHPVQWVAANVILTAAFVGFLEYKDRKATRETFEEIDEQKIPQTA